MRTSEDFQTLVDRLTRATDRVCRYVVEKIFSHYIADDVGFLPKKLLRGFLR